MVGGFDRYFQIARCLRDEDLRADRQFEFMQLDVEMSFADQEDVLDAVSVAVLAAAEVARPGAGVDPRMTWHEAMERFGTDKPDLRFGMELVELTDVFGDTEFRAFAGADAVKGIRVEGQADMTRSRLDALTERAKSLGAQGSFGCACVTVACSSRRSRSSCRSPSSSRWSTRWVPSPAT